MEFTEEEIRSFRKWEVIVRRRVSDEGYGIFYNLPPAPNNYDLWKFGPELIRAESTPVVPCRGGELVDPEWLGKKQQT